MEEGFQLPQICRLGFNTLQEYPHPAPPTQRRSMQHLCSAEKKMGYKPAAELQQGKKKKKKGGEPEQSKVNGVEGLLENIGVLSKVAIYFAYANVLQATDCASMSGYLDVNTAAFMLQSSSS